MSFVGADTAQLEQLEQQLNNHLTQLEQVAAKDASFVQRVVNAWQGPIASAFGQHWQSRDRPNIDSTIAALTQLRNELTRQREQQDTTSEVGPLNAPHTGASCPAMPLGEAHETTATAPIKPVASYKLEASAMVGIYDFVSVGGGGEVTLVEMSDGSIQLSVASGPRGGIGVPGLGLEAGVASGVTLELDRAEVKWLQEQGVPMPPGFGIDLENVSAKPLQITADDVLAVSVESDVGAALDGLGVNPATRAVLSELRQDSLERVDAVDASAKAFSGTEIRRTADGWEVAQLYGYSLEHGDVSKTGLAINPVTNPPQETAIGLLDLMTAYDVNQVTVERTESIRAVEVVYNTETHAGYFREIDTGVVGSSSGYSGGIDTPIVDETPLGKWTPAMEMGRFDSGPVSVTTTETKYDLSGNLISSPATTVGNGTAGSLRADIFVANAEGSYESLKYE